MSCPECAVGYHWECSTSPCCCKNEVAAAIEGKERGGQLKDPDSITDKESTGRKRAAQLYPIFDNMACEWRNLYLAGGGPFPIVGCDKGIAKHVHHGPDKNTINNTPTNVHRVCPDCHNRWHALNDSSYPSPRPPTNVQYLPVVESSQHDPNTKASEVEVVLSGIWFTTKAKTEPYATLRARFDQERLEANG